MDDTIKKTGNPSLQSQSNFANNAENLEWGENHQERMVGQSHRPRSTRHLCKQPNCLKTMEKF